MKRLTLRGGGVGGEGHERRGGREPLEPVRWGHRLPSATRVASEVTLLPIYVITPTNVNWDNSEVLPFKE